MPLSLAFAQNPAARFEEIRDGIVAKHFSFKLKDDFLILAPHEEARQDVERALLDHPRLEGVLIGRSVLTPSSWLQNILFFHPAPLPLATPLRMRRALMSALQALGLPWRPDAAAQRSLVYELGRLEHISRLTGQAVKPDLTRRLLARWQTELVDTYRCWTRGQAWQEALALLRAEALPSLRTLEDVYFLGFSCPDPEWTAILDFFHSAYPRIRLHLTLPPADLLLDKDGLLAAPLERIATAADSVPEYFPGPAPRLLKRAFATPLHEIRSVLREAGTSGEECLFLAPDQGSLRTEWEAEVKASYFPGGLALRLQALDSFAAFRALDRLSAADDDGADLDFDGFYRVLFPALQEFRILAARAQDAVTLRHLEAAFGLAQEWSRVETFQPRRMSRADWIAEWRQDLGELEVPPPVALAKRFPLRSLDRAGMARVERVYALGLNEGVYPPRPRPFQLAEDFVDRLASHEKKVALDLAFRLAKETCIASYSELSISGKTLQPAIVLSEGAWDIPAETRLELALGSSRRHPYFEENRTREAARRTAASGNPDAGDLRPFGFQELISQKIQNRPLGATYLDDYAKCPWRFFAAWHLRLEEKRAEELEIDPRKRGGFQHKILEAVFRRFLDAFSDRTYPEAEAMDEALEGAFAPLAEALAAAEDYREWPPVVLRDQLRRLRGQVDRLLAAEREHWRDSKEKLFPRHLEWSFGRSGQAPLSYPLNAELSVPLDGSIDRIDVSADGSSFLVLDYKASSTAAKAKDIRELLSLQLHVYEHAARELLYPKARGMGGLYWDLDESKKNQGLVSAEAYRPFSGKPFGNSLSFLKEEAYRQAKENLDNKLREILHSILAGDYALEPAACLGSLCDFSEICRYAKQPR